MNRYVCPIWLLYLILASVCKPEIYITGCFSVPQSGRTAGKSTAPFNGSGDSRMAQEGSLKAVVGIKPSANGPKAVVAATSNKTANVQVRRCNGATAGQGYSEVD